MADARAPKVAADPDDRARQRTQEQDLGDVGGPGDDLRSPGAGPGTGAPGGDTGLGHDWGGHRPPGIDEADATPGIDDLLGTDGSSGPDSLGGGLGAPPTGAALLDAAITPGSGLSTGLDPGLDPDAKGWDAGFDGVASEGEGPFHLVANPAGLYGKQTLFIDSNDEVRPISDLAPGTMVTWDVQKGGLLGASQFDLDADEVYADATGKAHAVVGYDNKLHNIGDGLGEPPADTEAAPARAAASFPTHPAWRAAVMNGSAGAGSVQATGASCAAVPGSSDCSSAQTTPSSAARSANAWSPTTRPGPPVASA